MSWNWDELTAPEFAVAAAACGGVCIVPVGVVEKHGEHLPLGTDYLFAREVAARAAAQEPAIIFPEYYFGQIHEAKHQPGAIAIRIELALQLLDNVCEEIARNGLRKIILLNGHGGNESLLPLFAQQHLEKPRDYTIYVIRLQNYFSPTLTDPEWTAQMVSAFDLHGGESETSTILAFRPELVKMEAITPTGAAQGRLKELSSVYTPIQWYADFPHHYAGDATHATAEKGEYLLTHFAASIAAIIKAVKADTRTAELEAEFFSKIQQ